MTRIFHRLTAVALFGFFFSLVGCTTQRGAPPPSISLDEPPVLSMPELAAPEPPVIDIAETPATLIEIPKPLPLPGQLMPIDANTNAAQTEARDPRDRIVQANQDALVTPSRDDFINAIQNWPYSDGALYQIYTSPGRVTVISLQQGETLVAVSAGDTARWIVGDTASGSGADRRTQILVKPRRPDLKTNMVITTDRRTYLLDMIATPAAWMASVSWNYPLDRLTALKNDLVKAEAAAPVAAAFTLDQLKFRYAISGDSPPWKPLRAFDDGSHVYIQFPSGIAQGELPPIFVVGSEGDAELVNYRFRSPYYIIDRLFGAAELRLGGDKAQTVRITRTDGNRSAGL